MLVHMRFPEELSRRGVHGIRVGMLVAKIGNPIAAARPDADRSTHGKIGVKHPMDAADLRAERIHLAFGAPHKDPTANDRGLSKRACDSGKTERPLEL